MITAQLHPFHPRKLSDPFQVRSLTPPTPGKISELAQAIIPQASVSKKDKLSNALEGVWRDVHGKHVPTQLLPQDPSKIFCNNVTSLIAPQYLTQPLPTIPSIAIYHPMSNTGPL